MPGTPDPKTAKDRKRPTLTDARALQEAAEVLESMEASVQKGVLPVPRKEIQTIVVQLIEWRERNGMSQRSAAEVMAARGFPVPLGTLKHWESGFRKPNMYASQALEAFLGRHPRIENPPFYRRGPK